MKRVQELFKAEVDGTEVRFVWKVGANEGLVFLQLDTEYLAEEPTEYFERYSDLLADHLADWVLEVVSET